MLMLKLTLRTLTRYSKQRDINLVHQFYTSQSISQRISALKQLTIGQSQICVDSYQIQVPSYFKMTTAKELVQYHKLNKTPPNINILHALAFIEFNAFQAYGDTLIRFGYSKQGQQFRQMMSDDQLNSFKTQFKSVAIDQGQHCQLLASRLRDLSIGFGQIPVISHLAHVVQLTKEDLLQRLALISIVHEGKGIKSVPKLIHKIQACKDQKSAEILRKIQSEETGHFLIGLKWFKHFLGKKINSTFSIKQESHQISKQTLQNVQLQLTRINKKYKTKIQTQDIRLYLQKSE